MPREALDLLLHIGAFLLGLGIVVAAILSAVRTFVLPRSAPDRVTRAVFLVTRALFMLWTSRARTYEEEDSRMALYAPLSLLALPGVWLSLVWIGYIPMYWALGVETLNDMIMLSGSSLVTLGYERPPTTATLILSVSQAGLGLTLVALLVSYLPAMYGAFQRREAVVNMLEVRAGSPPSAVELVERYHSLHRFDRLRNLWETWEVWFAEVEESHTSLPALVFFRSPRSEHSWVTAAGAVLDSGSFVLAALDIPHDPEANLCLRAGYICLRRIADYFGIEYDPDPSPDDPISITRAEFDEALDRLAEAGVPLKEDRDEAWRDFAGWRVNYDVPLLELAELTMAPYAPWSSDRGPAVRRRLRLLRPK